MPICSAGKLELASEVALHFEEGRDYAQAARCLMLTAENDSRRFAHADSIRVLQHALDLTRLSAAGGRPELEIEILQRIGDAHYALGAMSDSASAYEMAATRAADAGLGPAQVDALARLAFPAWYLDPERGNQICEHALEVSRIHGDTLVQAQRQLAAASFRLVYDAWREEDEKKCIAANRTIRDLSSAWVPEDVLYAYVRMVHGHYKEALEAGEVGLTASANLLFYLLAYRLKTLTLMLWGRFGEALRIVRSERGLAQKNGDDAWVFITMEVWLRALCFDFEGVRRLREICMRSDTEPYSPWTRAVSNLASGYAEFNIGNHELALQYFDQVRDSPTTRIFFLHWHLRLHAELGAAEAFLHAGDSASAGRQADRFLRLALSTAEPNMQVHAWDVKSRAAIATSDFDSARQCVHNALEILDRCDIPLAGWQIHRTAWNLYAALGDREKANTHRARAQGLIMRVADSFELGEPLRESFLTAPAIRRIFEQSTTA